MVSSLSGASLTSKAGIEQLVKLSTAREQKSVTDLRTKIEDLEVKRGIYTDVQSKLQAIETALADLRGSDGTGGSFNTFSAKVGGETGVFSSSVTDSSAAVEGSYDIQVTNLATRQSIATNGFAAGETFSAGIMSIQIGDGDPLEVPVEEDFTLADIVDAINDANGNVKASIVNDGDPDNPYRLLLTAKGFGTDNAIQSISFTGGDERLSFEVEPEGGYDPTYAGMQVTVPAENAALTINGIEVSSSSNTVEGVIPGVTLTLTAESQEAFGSTVTVAKDNSDIKAKINALLDAVNGAVKHLKLKTEPQLDDTAEGDNPTYKSAALGSDYSMRELRYGLTSDLLSFFSGAASGAPDNLMDLGVDVGDDNISLKLADADALTSALDDNFDGVLALFEHVADKLTTRLDRYIDDSSSIISRTQDSLDDQIESMEDRKTSASERLTRMEEMYRNQFFQMQAQLLTMQYEYQNTMSLMYSSQSLLMGNTNTTG